MSQRQSYSFLALALALLLTIVVIIPIGGRDDPLGPAATLDGEWSFRAGDDLAWANPRLDDRDWDRIKLVSSPGIRDNDVGLPGWLAGWRSHGHPNLEGYGWYRRQVVLPPGREMVLLGPTMVDDGYEMFWNGQRLGGIGRLGSDPKVMGARPYIVSVPPTPQGSGVLAIRTFMKPGLDRDELSGGLRSVPTLAERDFGLRLYRAQWMRSIAGYIVEPALAVTMTILAAMALGTAAQSNRPAFNRWLAVALVATGLLRVGNAIAAWTDLYDITVQAELSAFVLSPLAMFAWIAAWNAWADSRESRGVLLVATGAWLARIAGAIMELSGVTTAGRMVFLGLFAIIAVRIGRRGDRRGLALVATAPVGIAQFVTELSQLGVPTIWFPSNIGVTLTQYCYALTVLLLALLLARKALPAGNKGP